MNYTRNANNESRQSYQRTKNTQRKVTIRKFRTPVIDFDIDAVESSFRQALHDLQIVVQQLRYGLSQSLAEAVLANPADARMFFSLWTDDDDRDEFVLTPALEFSNRKEAELGFSLYLYLSSFCGLPRMIEAVRAHHTRLETILHSPLLRGILEGQFKDSGFAYMIGPEVAEDFTSPIPVTSVHEAIYVAITTFSQFVPWLRMLLKPLFPSGSMSDQEWLKSWKTELDTKAISRAACRRLILPERINELGIDIVGERLRHEVSDLRRLSAGIDCPRPTHARLSEWLISNDDEIHNAPETVGDEIPATTLPNTDKNSIVYRDHGRFSEDFEEPPISDSEHYFTVKQLWNYLNKQLRASNKSELSVDKRTIRNELTAAALKKRLAESLPENSIYKQGRGGHDGSHLFAREFILEVLTNESELKSRKLKNVIHTWANLPEYPLSRRR